MKIVLYADTATEAWQAAIAEVERRIHTVGSGYIKDKTKVDQAKRESAVRELTNLRDRLREIIIYPTADAPPRNNPTSTAE